jgi:arabinofuranan 3-O-arabinosyltransferase
MAHVSQARARIGIIASMCAGGLALAYPAYLALMFRAHAWILGAQNRPTVSDFLEVWVAGRTALAGQPAAAYDPGLHHAAEVAAAGHEFHHYLWWHYPPLFLFAAAGLALIPYVPAFIGWSASTLVFYSVTISTIARSRMALLVGCASPALFINAIGGQSGTLNAALIGAALVTLERRPLASGIFLGLLTYKPQFGILFPLVLIAGREWRAFLSATIASLLGLLVSWAVFGVGTFRAFLHFLPLATASLLVRGDNGWQNLQTVYGLVRWLGFDNGAGWAMQGIVVAFTAATLVWLWRRDVPFPLKAAALSAATLLATPYLYIYDFTILSVSFAFLYRQRAFDPIEIAGMSLAGIFVGAFLFIPAPVGLAAIALVLALVIRRWLQWEKRIALSDVPVGHHPAMLARNTSV